LENVAQFRYLGTTITNQNLIQEEIKRRLCNVTSSLREEHRLRVFENVVLRIIFGLKRDEMTGGWRIQHNEELHNL
jgi:chemotaxis methyl-accepting protein methylase